MAFYRGVCEANLGQAEKAQADFSAFLQLEPRATMDPSMYSKKAIAAFEAARKSAAPAEEPDARPAMFVAFQEFRLPANAGERVGENWADGPVQWIMTAEERRTWSQLSSGGEWQEFVDRFWESRNPRPGNPDNSFKTTFDRRVGFADANFVQAEGTRGSMTDRGMVFVLLGPPNFVGKKPLRTGDDASESAGMSTVGSRATAYAQRALTSAGEPAGSSGAEASGRPLRSGNQGPGLERRIPGDLALPPRAAAQGRGLPAGRRRLRHPQGLRRQRHAARPADAGHPRGGEVPAGAVAGTLRGGGDRSERK